MWYRVPPVALRKMARNRYRVNGFAPYFRKQKRHIYHASTAVRLRISPAWLLLALLIVDNAIQCRACESGDRV